MIFPRGIIPLGLNDVSAKCNSTAETNGTGFSEAGQAYLSGLYCVFIDNLGESVLDLVQASYSGVNDLPDAEIVEPRNTQTNVSRGWYKFMVAVNYKSFY